VFDPQMKFTGREYTLTIAWLAIAIIFIPAMTFAVHPGYLALALAFIGSMTCVVLSWVSWKRTSRLTIPPHRGSDRGAK
jgi:apolipoprotein N-acyltransferase